jgi:drug/metabolite transporter (DMT)-like permease
VKVPRGVAGGLALAIAFDTILQIAWKFAVAGIPESASALATARGALSTPYFYVALVVFPVQLFNWTRVLARADLSFAQPITSLSLITVLTFSSYIFHEKISWIDVLGVSMIFLGVFLISQTPYKTVPPSKNA